jgi:hypothetical protein
MKFLFFIIILVFSLTGCGSSSSDNEQLSEDTVTQNDISSSYAIDYLSDKPFIFPAIDPENRATTFQVLERFDLIFVGIDLNSASSIEYAVEISMAIPGTYTHMLIYIGKDSEGFAYAVEMNASKDLNYTIALDGLKVDGRLYVYCLGNDFGLDECPVDDHIYGLDIYDYMWGKQLNPELKKDLYDHEGELIATIKKDLEDAFPFQLPFHVGLETSFTKVIPITDDGRVNGADCTAYVMSLMEEIAGVCLDDVRMSAAEWESYYLNHPIGQQAILPEKFNILSEGDIYFSEVLTTYGYRFTDNLPRVTACSDKRIVTGMPIPDLVFNSPNLSDVPTVEARLFTQNLAI